MLLGLWKADMTPHPYTEDQLVEQPAIGLFAALGWQTICALEETFGPSPPAPLPKGEGSVNLGRETKGEVVLTESLRTALGKFNPDLPPEAIRNASTNWSATCCCRVFCLGRSV